jgi:hypothetical protein
MDLTPNGSASNTGIKQTYRRFFIDHSVKIETAREKRAVSLNFCKPKGF